MANRFTRKLSSAGRALLVTVAVASLLAPAQTVAQPVAGPVFEVTSVKPSDPTALPFAHGASDPVQFARTNITLRMLLLQAYRVNDYQLLGAPAMDGDKFDIIAKIPPGSTKEQVDVMLQNLLVERFGLAVHRETRELPVYDLVVAKGGLKMKEVEKPDDLPDRKPRSPLSQLSPGKDGFPELPHGIQALVALPTMSGGLRISARAATIAVLLTMLTNQIGGPVVDKTGLTGAYDFDLFYAIEGFRTATIPVTGAEPPFGQAADPADSPPPLRAAFESQLGLKLVPAKGPVEVLVVDHVNKKPTEN